MKLSGNKRSGRHLKKNVENGSGENGGKGNIVSRVWRKKPVRILSITVAVLMALSVGAYAYLRWGGEPPDINMEPRPNRNIVVNPADPSQPILTPAPHAPDARHIAVDNERNMSTRTFLIFGFDEGEGNTDVIMAVNFNFETYELNVLSIPRDTLVNVSWNLKKANSILPNMRHRARGQDDAEKVAMMGTVDKFADILGFEVDFWVTVNMRAFVRLVDAIGGVDFYVPVNMEYRDPYQDLHISFRRGMQRLNGSDALKVLRFRSGFASGDIGRINTQQDFLMAAAEQILAKSGSINIVNLADIFINNVRTNLPLSQVVWLGREFLKISSENINFVMLPVNNTDSVGGVSYPTILVDEWLEILNEMFNPFSQDKTEADLSILTRGADRRLYVTDGNWAGNPQWGSSSRGPGTSSGGGGGGVSTPTPTPSPTEDSEGDEADDPDGEETAPPELDPYGEESPQDGVSVGDDPLDEGEDRQQPEIPDTPPPQITPAPEPHEPPEGTPMETYVEP